MHFHQADRGFPRQQSSPPLNPNPGQVEKMFTYPVSPFLHPEWSGRLIRQPRRLRCQLARAKMWAALGQVPLPPPPAYPAAPSWESTHGGDLVTKAPQRINLDFRPRTYFWPLDLETHLLSHVNCYDLKQQ
jgi:hypothetical protein